MLQILCQLLTRKHEGGIFLIINYEKERLLHVKEVERNPLEGTGQRPNPNNFSARIYIKRSEENEELQKLYNADLALAPFGIRLSVGPSRYQDSKPFLACVMHVQIDREKISRGAGRHAMASSLTLEDVECMMADGLSPQEISDKVGFSLATYYRHMKKAMEQKEDGRDASKITF